MFTFSIFSLLIRIYIDIYMAVYFKNQIGFREKKRFLEKKKFKRDAVGLRTV